MQVGVLGREGWILLVDSTSKLKFVVQTHINSVARTAITVPRLAILSLHVVNTDKYTRLQHWI